MQFSFTLVDPTGAPVDYRPVEVLGATPFGDEMPLAAGESDKFGIVMLEGEAPQMPAFGVSVDGQPGILIPKNIEGDTVDFGQIVASPEPLFACELFPCHGECFAVPQEIFDRLGGDTGELQAQLDSTTAQLQSTQAQLDSATAQLESTQQQLSSTAAQLESTESQLQGAQTELATKTTELETAESQLAAKTTELETTEQQLVSKSTELATTEQQLSELESSLEKSLTDSQTLVDVLRTTSSSIETAGTELSQTSGSYSLGDVKVKLKAMMTQTGELAFVTESALKTVDASHLSEVEFSISPVLGTTQTSTKIPTEIVPDVGGYTRDLALRKLAGAGLYAELSAFAVDMSTSAADVGRVVQQSPAAGQPVPTTKLVRLFIGTPNQDV